jgi:hypothetical protein
VGGGVRPRTVGDPAVGLHLDDDGADTASGESGAEEPMGRRDRIDHELVCSFDHITSLDPVDTGLSVTYRHRSKEPT